MVGVFSYLVNHPANTLVCFALKEEAVDFSKLAAGKPSVTTLVTGIGKKNAERAVRDFLTKSSSTRVFTCGFAGGLDPALQIGDAVFSTDDPELREKLLAVGARAVPIHCAERIAVTVAEKQSLRQSTGADAVEMESEVIQAICHERGIPCATVRVISDTANEDLPLDFNKLAKPDMNLDMGKLALAVFKNPGKIPALKRLQQNTQLAAKKLAEVLDKVV